MNASTFKPANRFLDRVTVAQAAVEWHALPVEQQAFVVVNDGLPYLAGNPELEDRATALLDAAQRGLVTGVVFNEDGYPLRADAMRLDRTSVAAFIASVEARTSPAVTDDGEALLPEREVLKRIGKTRSTLHRWVAQGRFDDAHAQNPKAWRKGYVDAFLAGGGASEDEDI